ncbi:MAG: molybdenum cofactor guanylyltransferase [Nitrospirae bacterium]|nr:molybdenum cofactor guanylyltransferase [Nitrospirota bacterium]
MAYPITGVFLAGGQNRRFPSLKAFITVGGDTILRRSIDILTGCFDEVFISTNMPEVYFSYGRPMIGDVVDSRGPITGILSCLLCASNENVLVVACDMPFLKKEVVELVASGVGEGFDAVVPIFGGRLQPLLAVYNRTIVPRLQSMIGNNEKSLSFMLPSLHVKYVEEDIVRCKDAEGLSFVNVNTPYDLELINGVNVSRVNV